MNYKNKTDNPHERTRALRRLWEVEVFTSDDPDTDPTTRVETVVAWNHVDAIRRTPGQVAKQPVAKSWVSWPHDEDSAIRIVESPKVGPVGGEIETTVPTPTNDEWNI